MSRKPPNYMRFREGVTADDILKVLRHAAIRSDVLNFIDRLGKQKKFSKSDVSRALVLMKLCNDVGDTEYAQKLMNFLSGV
jgi:hypothetical protein